MDRYADNVPLNARITLNYDTDTNKPKVSFDYPEKMPRYAWIFHYIFPVVWYFYIFFIVVPIFVLFSIIQSWNEWAISTSINISLSLLRSITEACVAFSVTVFAIPLLISFVIGYNYDRVKHIFPKFQIFVFKIINVRHEHQFCVKNLDKPSFEIPLFRNMYLSYELSGDYAKQIDRVEVHEHDFKQSGKPEHELWKATFFFKSVPKDGYLKGSFL